MCPLILFKGVVSKKKQQKKTGFSRLVDSVGRSFGPETPTVYTMSCLSVKFGLLLDIHEPSV